MSRVTHSEPGLPMLLCKEFGKGIKIVRVRIPFGWRGFDRKFLGYSHIWSTPHVINAILGHYARFWIFWRESFEAHKQRLEARGSRLAARGSGSQARQIASPEFYLIFVMSAVGISVPSIFVSRLPKNSLASYCLVNVLCRPRCIFPNIVVYKIALNRARGEWTDVQI